MADKPDHTLEDVLVAAEKGITKTGAAQVLHCSRRTMQRYCRRWASVEQAFQDKRRELVDLAEMGLRGAVLRQEHWAVCYTLSTLGKDEGYTTRQEVTGKDGDPISMLVEVKVVDDRNG